MTCSDVECLDAHEVRLAARGELRDRVAKNEEWGAHSDDPQRRSKIRLSYGETVGTGCAGLVAAVDRRLG
jgi:hypothetical protein